MSKKSQVSVGRSSKFWNAIKITSEEMDRYVNFITEILPLLMKPGYFLMDELNINIKYFKGIDILTYYTPIDPTKDKEPILNKTLQKKWQPKKTVNQKQAFTI